GRGSLKVSGPGGAERFVAGLYDPTSPYYLQFLTPGQFMERFGPDKTTLNRVKGHFEKQGFAVEQTGLLLNLKAEASTFEQSFKVQFNNYTAINEGQPEQFYSADRLPLVEDDLKPYVQSV